MASWNIKSHLSLKRDKEKEREEVLCLKASLPLRYRLDHVMYTWGGDTRAQQEDWRVESPGDTENRQTKTPNRNIKKKRRFFKGSLSHISENEDDFPKKDCDDGAKTLNQIKASAKHDRRDRYDDCNQAESHKYLLRFLETHSNNYYNYHNINTETYKLFKSLSDPELNIAGSEQSRYVFPAEGRHYDVEKMSRYVEKKKRSREESPLAEISPPDTPDMTLRQQEREVETCEILPDQFFLY